jgi:Sec-independent protein translocase protein TatA
MELLGIGPLELAFIIIIAVIVIGPRDIGNFARSAGRFLNKLYRSEEWKALNQASRNLRSLPNRLAREAALDELERTRQEAQKAIVGDRSATAALQDSAPEASPPSWAARLPTPGNGMQAWVPPTQDSPASDEPADAAEETPTSDPPA